jgi:hypothetical protein
MKRNGTGYHYQFLTPQKLKNEILHQMHNSVLSGHLGKKKTKEQLSQRNDQIKLNCAFGVKFHFSISVESEIGNGNQFHYVSYIP